MAVAMCWTAASEEWYITHVHCGTAQSTYRRHEGSSIICAISSHRPRYGTDLMAKPRNNKPASSRRHQLRQPERLEDRLVMDGAGFVNTDPPEDPDSIVGAAGVVASDDYVSLPAGTQSLRIAPLANDELPEGATRLTIKSVSGTAQGAAVTVTDDGQHLLYTAAGDNGFQSWDSFYYIVQTEDGRLGKANVQLGQKPTGGHSQPPIRVYDRFTVLEDSGETRLDVLRNDPLTDPEVIAVSMPSLGGSLRIADDGSAIYYAYSMPSPAPKRLLIPPATPVAKCMTSWCESTSRSRTRLCRVTKIPIMPSSTSAGVP